MTRGLFDRHLRPIVAEALSESRGVAILGARQVGKSTLASVLARNEFAADEFNLDDEATRRAAIEDPAGFIAGLSGPVVIDEIQRAPDLLLAMKERMDADNTRGQFLVTGSANLLTLRSIHDALPGRMIYLTLWPLSQGELIGRREDFIDRLFAGEFPRVSGVDRGRAALRETDRHRRLPRGHRQLAAGAQPLLLQLRRLDARPRPHDGRARPEPSGDRPAPALAREPIGAAHNFNAAAHDIGLDQKTAQHYGGVLAQLYLVRQIPSWHTNLGQRQIKSPKAYVSDTGLLAYLTGTDEDRLTTDPGGNLAGMFFETFVAMELVRHSEWAEHEVHLHHYRDKAQREADVVLERNSGELIAIEVKAAATVWGG